jgi:hypothetical protein
MVNNILNFKITPAKAGNIKRQNQKIVLHTYRHGRRAVKAWPFMIEYSFKNQ